MTKGKAGRLSAAPEGGVFVRDPAAARAHAVQERVQAFKDAGEKVPAELAALVAEFEVSDDDEDVNLLDRVTGELLAEGETEIEIEEEIEVVVEETEPAPEPAPEPQAEPEPEPELEPEPQPEPEPEPEPEPVVAVDSLTVAELKAELDKRGVQYGANEQKASLQVRLRDALKG